MGTSFQIYDKINGILNKDIVKILHNFKDYKNNKLLCDSGKKELK